MKPEVQQAELAKQHDRAHADWMRLIGNPDLTVELVDARELAPTGDYALSVVTPASERGFWMGTAASHEAAVQLAEDLGVKVAEAQR